MAESNNKSIQIRLYKPLLTDFETVKEIMPSNMVIASTTHQPSKPEQVKTFFTVEERYQIKAKLKIEGIKIK